ncbi:MAG: hypothetical protein P8Z38_09035 [Robiginitalea sp.]
MNTIVRLMIPVVMLCCLQQLTAQQGYQKKIEELKAQRELIVKQEKEALKNEVMRIEDRLEAGEINTAEAQRMKEAAAEKHALNIKNRQAIIDNEIALLQRNKEDAVAMQDTLPEKEERTIVLEYPEIDDDCEFWGIGCDHWDWDSHKYDKRTYSDLVIAFGLSNADVDGQSLEDTPYKVAGSRFFEIGWNWRTRVFRNSNWLRFHYGFMFQFNGLKPKGNQSFVVADGTAVLEEFQYDLRKSKFRMDNLVVPLHFEVGPSRRRVSEQRIRYSLKKQFRFGFGGYAGIKLGARQKLKYTREGDRVKDKLKGGYNTSDFVYGLSTYMGAGGVLLYFKYDLNPIFQDAEVEQRFIALGLRLDI